MSNETLRKGELTRAQIVRAAHELFVRQGYHGTSMRQIAQQAGIALGGLYNHFASKEDVFLAVIWEFHPYHDVIPAIQAAQGEPIEKFSSHVINRMVAAVSESPGFMNLMFIEVVEFKGKHLGQLFSTLAPQWRQVAENILQAEGDRLRPIPPLMFMHIFLGIFFAYYLTEVLFAPQAPLEFSEGAINRFTDVFLHGVLAAPLSAKTTS